jgi:hypothetical protein
MNDQGAKVCRDWPQLWQIRGMRCWVETQGELHGELNILTEFGEKLEAVALVELLGRDVFSMDSQC